MWKDWDFDVAAAAAAAAVAETFPVAQVPAAAWHIPHLWVDWNVWMSAISVTGSDTATNSHINASMLPALVTSFCDLVTDLVITCTI